MDMRAKAEALHEAIVIRGRPRLADIERALTDAYEAGRRDKDERLRSIVARMREEVSSPTGIYRGHCRWCSAAPATGEPSHHARCPFASLVDALATPTPATSLQEPCTVEGSSKLPANSTPATTDKETK